MLLWQQSILSLTVKAAITSKWPDTISAPSWHNGVAVDLRQSVMSARTAIEYTGGDAPGPAFQFNGSRALELGNSPFTLGYDFTWDGFIYFDDITSRTNQYIIDYGSNGLTFRFYGGRLLVSLGGSGTALDTSFTPVINRWYHYAVVRKGGQLSMYIDGLRIAQSTFTSVQSYSSITYGNYGGGGAYAMLGKLARPRVLQIALYDGPSFEVPTTFLPYGDVEPAFDPLWGKTNMLFKTGTDSTGLNTPSYSGTVVSSSFTRYGSGTSFQVNGSSFVRVPTIANSWDMGTLDFCVEAWIYPTASMSGLRHVIGRKSSTISGGFYLGLSAMRPVLYYSTGTGGWSSVVGNVSGSEVPLNNWTHLAFVRSGTDIRLYVNGDWVAGANGITGALATTTIPLTIGATDSGTEAFIGYIDRPRSTRGSPRYMARFTPRLTTDYATVAATNGDLLSNTSDPLSDLVSVYFPFVDTAQEHAFGFVGTLTGGTPTFPVDKPLFGQGALNLTNGNNYLTYTVGRQVASALDFTIEGWINTNYTESSSSISIISQYDTTADTGWTLGSISGKAVFYYGVSTRIISTADIADGQWHHLAVTLTGGVLTLYVDGVSVGTASKATRFTFTGVMRIGSWGTAFGASVYCRQAHCRVTNGAARYTSNFAVPSAPPGLSTAV